MPMDALTQRQRSFFREVARAAFANPFSTERAEVDDVIARESRRALHEAKRVERMMNAVAGEVEELERSGLADVRKHSGESRSFMRTALLFDVFHRHIDAIDRHIEEQLRAGDEPAPALFATAIQNDLLRRGFSSEASLHFLAIFFQLRRAFYFIARGLLGESASMRRFRERLWQNIFTRDVQLYDEYLSDRMEDFSTLLLGETGTGKGAAAAAIGRSGFIPFNPRSGCFKESFTRAFVSLNLSQFPETLIESELFGHRKGAFTGAMDNYQGIFARCSPHGAIFLDEIGDVTVPIQIKLLHVLQERRFTPVGSHEPQRFSGRVIAATNRPLDTLRAEGKFRDDFYYRLCSDVIEVPPLRQRIQESPTELQQLLREIVVRITGDDAEHIAKDIAARLKKSPGRNHAWPGNVRELEQATRQILLTGVYSPTRATAQILKNGDILAAWRAGTLTAAELVAAYCTDLYQQFRTYEEVARRTKLDGRTVKKYLTKGS
ncbi:MAG: sigma 54-interacting transcriptional regulator [Kiritimatiellae bacterium]|nr:sigma 54-interacting transcriptional regulator [Kiritimatiellia bacterium]